MLMYGGAIGRRLSFVAAMGPVRAEEQGQRVANSSRCPRRRSKVRANLPPARDFAVVRLVANLLPAPQRPATNASGTELPLRADPLI